MTTQAGRDMRQTRFGFDPEKARSNLAKHGVSFDEAQTVFENRLYLQAYDHKHSGSEDRWQTVGVSEKSRVLVVVTTERDGELIWIISARKATRTEKKAYEDEIKNRVGE